MSVIVCVKMVAHSGLTSILVQSWRTLCKFVCSVSSPFWYKVGELCTNLYVQFQVVGYLIDATLVDALLAKGYCVSSACN